MVDITKKMENGGHVFLSVALSSFWRPKSSQREGMIQVGSSLNFLSCKKMLRINYFDEMEIFF